MAKPAETGSITVAGDNCGSMVNGREYAYGPISAAPPVISARFNSEDRRLDIADSHRIGVVASASFLNRKSALPLLSQQQGTYQRSWPDWPN